jgi:hypothetical protein
MLGYDFEIIYKKGKHNVVEALLHIENIATTTCDESTILFHNSRKKVQFFNFYLNTPRIRRSIDKRKLSSVFSSQERRSL